MYHSFCVEHGQLVLRNCSLIFNFWPTPDLLYSEEKMKNVWLCCCRVKGAWTTKSDTKLEKMTFSVFWFVQLLLFLEYGIKRITVITSLSSWHIIITFYDPLFGFVVTFLFNVDSLQDFSPNSSISKKTIKSLEYSMFLYVRIILMTLCFKAHFSLILLTQYHALSILFMFQ